MKIIERKRAKHPTPGYLNSEVDWHVNEKGRVYIAVDDLVDTLIEMRKLNLHETALRQLDHVINALIEFQAIAETKGRKESRQDDG